MHITYVFYTLYAYYIRILYNICILHTYIIHYMHITYVFYTLYAYYIRILYIICIEQHVGTGLCNPSKLTPFYTYIFLCTF